MIRVNSAESFIYIETFLRWMGDENIEIHGESVWFTNRTYSELPFTKKEAIFLVDYLPRIKDIYRGYMMTQKYSNCGKCVREAYDASKSEIERLLNTFFTRMKGV